MLMPVLVAVIPILSQKKNELPMLSARTYGERCFKHKETSPLDGEVSLLTCLAINFFLKAF